LQPNLKQVLGDAEELLEGGIDLTLARASSSSCT
jgi:hypothetical protein